MTRSLVLLGALAAVALLLFGAPEPTDAAPRRRTPIPTPTFDLRGQFRIGQVVEWTEIAPTVGPTTPTPTPRPAIFRFSSPLAMGGTSDHTIAVRVATPLSNVSTRTLAVTGEVEVVTPPPQSMVPGQEYQVTIRLTRPRDRRPTAGYLQLKNGNRFLAPLLQIRTRNAPGER